MKPIRAKEGAQLLVVVLCATLGSVLIDVLPYWREPLKLACIVLAIAAVYKIGK